MSHLHGQGVRRPGVLGGAAVVTITNDTNSAFNFGADANAYHQVNTDGTLDERDNNGLPIQINASTDWIIPNGAASSSYRVRHSSEAGDTGADWIPPAALNTWIAISVLRAYRVRDTTVFFGGNSVTYTMEIDMGGGTALDSGIMTLTADREDF